MAKRTVRDVDVTGKRVLVRVDFNVPLKDGKVADDTRIRASLATIEYLRERHCRVILMSHLGRPKDGPDESLRMDPVAMRLAQLLSAPVRKVDELSGPGVAAAVDALGSGDVLLLENSRFDPREKKNDPTLVKELASLGDLYVNDAFSAAHRAHATTAGLAGALPSVAGFQMEKELVALDGLLSAPKRPFVVVLGGAKVTDKIKVIDRFLDLADALLIGGAMSFTFLKAQGADVGASKVDDEGLGVAAEALKKAEQGSCELLLPTDVVAARGILGRLGHPGGRRRQHAPGLDGSRHRSADRSRLREEDRRRGGGVLERSHGRLRDGTVRGRHSGRRRGHGCEFRSHGGGRGRLRRCGQQVRRGRQDGSRLHGWRGVVGAARRSGVARRGRPARQGREGVTR